MLSSLTTILRRQLILGSLAAVFALSTVAPSYAQAAQAVRCSAVQNDPNAPKPYSLEWRVEGKKIDLEDLSAPGGALTFEDRPLSTDSQVAFMELIRMISATRAVQFSYKAFRGKEYGELVIGIPLANKYSLEISYKSDYREGQEETYGADSVKIVTPSGKAELARGNMRHIETGSFHKDLQIDLTDYPAIADRNFTVSVPEVISADALGVFNKIAPKLDYLTKAELREISKTNNYLKLKALIHIRHAKARIKEFLFKGPFKTFYKLVFGLPLTYFLLVQVNTHFQPEIMAAKSMLAGDQNQWVSQTLSRSLEAEQVPVSVKNDIRKLMSAFDAGQMNQTMSSQMKREFPPDLNAPGKFQVSKDQYMWIEKVVDQTQNKEVTLLFVSQDSRAGQIQYAVTVLDSEKYKTLIAYMNSHGQFLPLQIDGALK
jgi:hypothetical protein